MDRETSLELCRSLAKAYSTGVRLYEKETCLFYYAVSNMQPDPAIPYLSEIFSS